MASPAPKRRGDARERILDVAEASVLEKGFDATSIDELIAADPTFGSRFYESLACTLASRVRNTSRRVLMVARSRKDRRTGIERRKDWVAEE